MESKATLIRTIVCAYTVDEMTIDAAQVHRRFENAVAKADWAIRVRLEPIEDLPDAFEVLVVPPELRERGRERAGGAHLIVASRQNAASACGLLLREIEKGELFTATRRDPKAPKIVKRRGFEVL